MIPLKKSRARAVVEYQMWSAKERTGTGQYLERRLAGSEVLDESRQQYFPAL